MTNRCWPYHFFRHYDWHLKILGMGATRGRGRFRGRSPSARSDRGSLRFRCCVPPCRFIVGSVCCLVTFFAGSAAVGVKVWAPFSLSVPALDELVFARSDRGSLRFRCCVPPCRFHSARSDRGCLVTFDRWTMPLFRLGPIGPPIFRVVVPPVGRTFIRLGPIGAPFAFDVVCHHACVIVALIGCLVTFFAGSAASASKCGLPFSLSVPESDELGFGSVRSGLPSLSMLCATMDALSSLRFAASLLSSLELLLSASKDGLPFSLSVPESD